MDLQHFIGGAAWSHLATGLAIGTGYWQVAVSVNSQATLLHGHVYHFVRQAADATLPAASYMQY